MATLGRVVSIERGHREGPLTVLSIKWNQRLDRSEQIKETFFDTLNLMIKSGRLWRCWWQVSSDRAAPEQYKMPSVCQLLVFWQLLFWICRYNCSGWGIIWKFFGLISALYCCTPRVQFWSPSNRVTPSAIQFCPYYTGTCIRDESFGKTCKREHRMHSRYLLPRIWEFVSFLERCPL